MNTSSLPTSIASSPPHAASLVLRMLEALKEGAIACTLPDGSQLMRGEGSIVAHLHIHDWEVFEAILARGSIGFAESWMDGQWTTDRLAGLLTLMACSRPSLQKAIHGDAWRLLLHRMWHLCRRNSRAGSRRNIEAHYDLGNDFYALWLDETMTYSSAYFAAGAGTLPDAQRDKYRRILRRLDARPGQRILEIGCGWGGFAEVAAREFSCHVHGITLSSAQLEWARRRAEQGRFTDRATFELRDYRDLQGTFDHIVSIEMIEAVGEKYWPTYFRALHDRVAPDGRIVIQGITIADGLFAHYRRDVDFIQRYIFPGGMLPSPSVLRHNAERAGLRLDATESFGRDYAKTLAEWAHNFDACCEQVHAQGFDERFVRMWQFYLAYCEAGFLSGSTDVAHFELRRA